MIAGLFILAIWKTCVDLPVRVRMRWEMSEKQIKCVPGNAHDESVTNLAGGAGDGDLERRQEIGFLGGKPAHSAGSAKAHSIRRRGAQHLEDRASGRRDQDQMRTPADEDAMRSRATAGSKASSLCIGAYF